VATELAPFLRTPATAFGKPIARLGLASYSNSSLTPDDFHGALDRGVSFLNWAGLAEGPNTDTAFTRAIATLGGRRESVVVCVQFGARTADDAKVELRAVLEALGTDYVDVLTIY